MTKNVTEKIKVGFAHKEVLKRKQKNEIWVESEIARRIWKLDLERRWRERLFIKWLIDGI